MKVMKLIVLIAGLLLVAVAANAVDPACEGATQAPTLNWSDGNGALCMPVADVEGTTIPDVKVMECTVTFRDQTGADIGSETYTGGPGSHHPFNVPRDGEGSAVGVCTLDGLSSDVAAGTVNAVYPMGAAPAPPVTLP